MNKKEKIRMIINDKLKFQTKSLFQTKTKHFSSNRPFPVSEMTTTNKKYRHTH